MIVLKSRRKITWTVNADSMIGNIMIVVSYHVLVISILHINALKEGIWAMSCLTGFPVITGQLIIILIRPTGTFKYIRDLCPLWMKTITKGTK